MFKKNLPRILIAAVCGVVAFAVLIALYFTIGSGEDMSSSVLSVLWLPAVYALTDILFYVLYDTNVKSNALNLLKNILHGILIIVNIAAFVFMFVMLFIKNNNFDYIAEVAVTGIVTIGMPLKYIGLTMYKKESLPKFLAPFVSIITMALGYAVLYLLLFICVATSAHMAFDLIPIILPLVLLIPLIIYLSVSYVCSIHLILFPFYDESKYGRRRSEPRDSDDVVTDQTKGLASKYAREMSRAYSYSCTGLHNVNVSIEAFTMAKTTTYTVSILAKATTENADLATSGFKSILQNQVPRDLNRLMNETISTLNIFVKTYPDIGGSSVKWRVIDANIEYE